MKKGTFCRRHAVELADAQRDEPEEAMNRAQSALGGGLASFVIEHVGDLNHGIMS